MAKSKSAKKPRKTESKEKRPSSGRSMPRREVFLAGAALLFVGAVAGAAYIYRTEIADGFTTGHDTILSYLGFGVLPIAAWLAGAVGVAKYREQGLGQPRVWAASLLLLAAAFGVLAFFSFQQGAMAYFTLDGEYGLGGKLGQWVSGIYGGTGSILGQALGALRVTVLVFTAVGLVSPVLAMAAGEVSLAVLTYLYVRTVMVLRAAFSALRRRLRRKPGKDIADMDPEDTFISDVPVQDGAWQDLPAAPMFDTSIPGSVSTLGASFSETPQRRTVFAEASGASAVFAETSGASASYDLSPDTGPTVEEAPGRRAVFGGATTAATLGQAVQETQETIDILPVNGSHAGQGDADLDTPTFAPTREDTEEPENGVEEDTPSSGRFNRFWSMTDPDADGKQDDDAPVAPEDAHDGINGSSATMEPDDLGEAADKPVVRGLREWTKPPIQILDDAPQTFISNEEIVGTANAIKSALADYGVEVEIGQAKPGPAVTMYGLTPGWVRRYKQVRERNEDGSPKLDEKGKQVIQREETKTRVKVDTILHREKDLALALKTPSIRIETPVMGQSLLGIEVPNPNPSVVSLRSVMDSQEFAKLRSDSRLAMALGKGSGGETTVTDLTKTPHLLIAGATGSGKSVCINGIVSCLIMEKAPDELRLLLVDPKRVELTPYNGIPHLLTPVVVETDQVVGLLKGVIREMMDRYRMMEEKGVRNIEAYNRRSEVRMPFLVVVVDELADLMMTASFDVEQSLCRLAQLGRATGIHLVIATQRPSVDVLTGLIKANFPSRISFGVTSQIDSRTILDTAGAEKLLGRGDMLFQPIDASRPERVQGVWISDSEIEQLVTYWQSAPRGPLPEVNLQAVPEDDTSDDIDRSEDRDDMMDKAIELAQTQSKLSTSLLQRRLRIGYPRAARLMDQLEEEGIVGPSDGSRSRDVTISTG